MTQYTETDEFDIRAGMAVYSAAGENIGTVLEIAGFGATRVSEASTSAVRVTQAHSGTGFIKVKRDGAIAGPDVTIPFRSIQGVDKDGHVIVDTGAGTPSAAPAPTSAAEPEKRKGWRSWGSSNKKS